MAADDPVKPRAPGSVLDPLGAAPRLAPSSVVEPPKDPSAAAGVPSPEEPSSEETSPDIGTLEAIGEVCAKYGHDFNNLFAIIQGGLELLELRATQPDFDTAKIEGVAQFIRTGLRRGVQLSREMRSFIRCKPLVTERCPLGAVVEEAVALFNSMAMLPITIEVVSHANPVVEVQHFSVVQVLCSVALNAAEAMRTLNDRLLVFHVRSLSKNEAESLANASLTAERYAAVSIVDHGTGIDEEIRDRLFQPLVLVRRDEVTGSLGLHLPMAHALLEQHHGKLVVSSVPHCGTAVHLLFPEVESAA